MSVRDMSDGALREALAEDDRRDLRAVRDALPGPLGIVLGALWAVVPLVLLFVVAQVLGALDRRRLLAEEFRED